MHGIIKISGFYYGQHRPENFFLGDARVWVHIRDHRWFDEVAGTMMASSGYQLALAFADLDILGDLLLCVRIDNRSDECFWLCNIAHGQLLRFLYDLLQDLVIDLVNNDGAGACRTFLPLEAKSGSDDTCGGGIEISRFVYDESEERRVGKECRSRWSPYE